MQAEKPPFKFLTAVCWALLGCLVMLMRPALGAVDTRPYQAAGAEVIERFQIDLPEYITRHPRRDEWGYGEQREPRIPSLSAMHQIVHQSFEFTVPTAGKLYLACESRVPEKYSYQEDPEVWIEERRDGGWRQILQGHCNHYHGRRLKTSAPSPTRRQPDGNVALQSQAPYVEPSKRYRVVAKAAAVQGGGYPVQDTGFVPTTGKVVVLLVSTGSTWQTVDAPKPTGEAAQRIFSATEIDLQDATVSEYSHRNTHNANFGAAQYLMLGSQLRGIPNTRRRIYIRFNVENLGVPVDQIEKVELQLSPVGQKKAQGEVEINVYRVQEAWEEGNGQYHLRQDEPTASPGQLTWNQQPAWDNTRVWARQTLKPASRSAAVSWDITELVKAWLSGRYPNQGLVLIGQSEGSTAYRHVFASAEYGDPSQAPKLIVTLRSADTWPRTEQESKTPPSPSKLSCEHKDNEEHGCCCFKGTHTYRFPFQYVSSAQVRFDTGRELNCRSRVELQVDKGRGWETLRHIEAVSSSGSNKFAPLSITLPVDEAIQGFRFTDSCTCCIDFSELTLEAQGPPSAESPSLEDALRRQLHDGLRSLFE